MNNKLKMVIQLFSVIILLSSKYCYSITEQSQTKEVLLSAALSAKYLEEAVNDNGMFVYRINLDPSIAVKEKYNILRHAGTLYSLAMYHQVQPDQGTQDALERGGTYLLEEAVGPINGHDDILAVWSKPEVNRSGNELQAKLGGTGLGLIALISLEDIHPGFTPLRDLRALGRFITFMQKPDGSFYSKFYHHGDGRSDSWTSLYYPGEAALGLLMLYEKDPLECWLDAAVGALVYLAESRKNSLQVPLDNWALLATAKLFSLKEGRDIVFPEELLIEHASTVCREILSRQLVDPIDPLKAGGFSWDGRTTPTSTCLEGLQAATTFLPEDSGLHKSIDVAVKRGIAFLLRAQVKTGENRGATPRAIAQSGQGVSGAEDFNRRATEVRIDYVQHSLSAMVQYLIDRESMSVPRISEEFQF